VVSSRSGAANDFIAGGTFLNGSQKYIIKKPEAKETSGIVKY